MPIGAEALSKDTAMTARARLASGPMIDLVTRLEDHLNNNTGGVASTSMQSQFAVQFSQVQVLWVQARDKVDHLGEAVAELGDPLAEVGPMGRSIPWPAPAATARWGRVHHMCFHGP